SSRRRHTRFSRDWSSDVCSSDLGQGLVVKKAVELRDAGLPFEEVVSKVEDFANHMTHIFTVENLDYLAAGGRISKSSAFFGGLRSEERRVGKDWRSRGCLYAEKR